MAEPTSLSNGLEWGGGGVGGVEGDCDWSVRVERHYVKWSVWW